MKGEYSREACIRILKDKQSELNESGISRFPRRSDFDDAEVCAVKAFLGPWPRALEAAGIKPDDDNRRQKKLVKRINVKRRITEALKPDKKSGADSSDT